MERRLIFHTPQGQDALDSVLARLQKLEPRTLEGARVVSSLPSAQRYLVVTEDTPELAARLRAIAAALRRQGIGTEVDRRLRSIAPSFSDGSKEPVSSPGYGAPPTGPSAGAGVAIAILDASGVKRHDAFGERLTTFDVTKDEVEEIDPVISPGRGHGTAMASVAAGTGECGAPAPEARIVAYRATWTWQFAKALDHMIESSPDVKVAVTAQIAEFDPAEGCLGAPSVLREAVSRAREQGIVLVAAAGNDGYRGDGQIGEPALYADAVAIGAYDDRDWSRDPSTRDRVHIHSSRGPAGLYKPDVLFRWGNYVAAGPDPARTNDYFNGAYGTSMASAYAAGVIATWMATFPGLTPEGVHAVIETSEVCELLKSGPFLYRPNDQGHGAIVEVNARSEVLRRAGL